MCTGFIMYEHWLHPLNFSCSSASLHLNNYCYVYPDIRRISMHAVESHRLLPVTQILLALV